MSEMVERVAKAIYEGRNGAGCKPWSRLPSGHKAAYLGDAEIAIEAMREPTEPMLDACWPHHHPWGEYAPSPKDRPDGFAAMQGRVTRDWQAMIDAALANNAPQMPNPQVKSTS